MATTFKLKAGRHLVPALLPATEHLRTEMILRPQIADWLAEKKIPYTLVVSGGALSPMTIEDTSHAVLFKLTWM